MSDQDAFERILASLYEAMLDDALWPATSALIDEACGLQGNALLIGTGPKDDAQTRYVGLHYRGERREDYEREYLTVYYPIDESVPRFRQLPDSQLVPLTDLYTEQELKTSLAYNEGHPKGNTQNSVTARLDGLDGTRIAWLAADPVAPGGWDSSQLALLKGLLPHIRQFVRVRQALANAQALGASTIDLLGTRRIGIIHLDRRGQIVEANDRARSILRHSDGLLERDGMLRAREPAAHTRLERLIARALPSARLAVSGSLLLHRSALLPPFIVHVKPVGIRQPDYGVQHVAALVLITEPGRPSPIDPHLVAETLGLTPAEGQIAVRLAKGQTVREIAEATGRTPETIRWHLKHIYHKQQLSGQADLIRVVLSLAEFAHLEW